MELLLTIFAIVLSVYVFFVSMKKFRAKEEIKPQREETQADEETDPLLEDYQEQIYNGAKVPELSEPVIKAPKETIKANDYVAFSIVPKQQAYFPGRMLLSVFKANQLSLNKQGVFVRYDADGESQPLFSIVSLVEPGTFNAENLASKPHPGLILYLVLSNVVNPLAAFDKMLKSGRQLAAALNGELQDRRRQPLTAQMIVEYRQSISDYINRNQPKQDDIATEA